MSIVPVLAMMNNNDRLLHLRTWSQIQDGSIETGQNLKTGGVEFDYFSRVTG